MYMRIGFHIRHVARKLEFVAGALALGGVFISQVVGAEKRTQDAKRLGAGGSSLSWGERRRAKRELHAVAEKERVMREMYASDPKFRAAVDRAAAPKSWWAT
jgi:hypothetical protein